MGAQQLSRPLEYVQCGATGTGQSEGAADLARAFPLPGEGSQIGFIQLGKTLRLWIAHWDDLAPRSMKQDKA
jgi:hypothetical protein